MNSDELISLIEGAFPAHPIPEVTLRQATLSAQGMRRKISNEEWESAGRIDRDVPWTDLSDDDLTECENSVAHLTEPEFGYYLGALLRFAVRHLDAGIGAPEGALLVYVIFSVTRDSDYARARWTSLNPRQAEAVRCFLDYVVAHSDDYRADAAQGLARYWSAMSSKASD